MCTRYWVLFPVFTLNFDQLTKWFDSLLNSINIEMEICFFFKFRGRITGLTNANISSIYSNSLWHSQLNVPDDGTEKKSKRGKKHAAKNAKWMEFLITLIVLYETRLFVQYGNAKGCAENLQYYKRLWLNFKDFSES